MYSKLLILATVGFVAAQDAAIYQLKNDAGATGADIAGLDARVAAIEGKAGAVADGVETAQKGFSTVDSMTTKIADVRGTVAGMDAQLAGKLSITKMQLENRLAMAEREINGKLEDALSQITATLSDQYDQVENGIKTDLGIAENGNEYLETETAALIARVNLHKECSKTGIMYSAQAKKCVGVEASAAKQLPRVAQRYFNNEHGREGGYVNNREVSFTKKFDDTYIRIFYIDNFRCHGHTSHGRWNVMICDSNGNGCDHCAAPGRIMHWRYSSHQHNWWMFDRWGAGVTGLCKKSGNRDIRKGAFKLKVMLDDARYDISTGSNQHNSFMVDEVWKY